MIFFREEVCKKFWKELYVLKTQLENFHKIETKFYEIMKSESSDGDLETFLNDKTGLLKNYAEIIKNCDSIK